MQSLGFEPQTPPIFFAWGSMNLLATWIKR